jgi:hypothetical protein
VKIRIAESIDQGDLDEAHDSVMISDLSVLLDRKTTAPFFCMVQYYGGKRSFGPQLMFIYNFDQKCWSIIDNRSLEFQSSHTDKMLNQFNPSTDNLQQLKDHIKS